MEDDWPEWSDFYLIFDAYRGSGMGGVGHLPDVGGTNDQSSKMMNAFAIAADWEARIRKSGD